MRDTRVARVLDLLAALGRARRRATAGATVPGSGCGNREGGEDGEGKDLGEHRGHGGGGGMGRWGVLRRARRCAGC
jgi:hypothetical protein